MRIHPRGVLVLLAFAALMMLGVQVRWVIPAAMAIPVVDCLSLGGLLMPRDANPR
jgi:hypothetical protein